MHFNRRINSMNIESWIELVDRNFNQFNQCLHEMFFSRYSSYFKTHVSQFIMISKVIVKN